MSICLCMETAERILNRIALGRLRVDGRAGQAVLSTCGTSQKELNSAAGLLGLQGETLHALVGGRGRRTYRGGIVSHVWTGSVAQDALIRIAPGIYVASPELNALLMMRGRKKMHRAQILMSYCGLFAIDESAEDGFVKRAPLTTVSKLRECALRLRGEPCAKAMLEALELTLECARSPMEPRLALLFMVGRRQGGFGFEPPELNAVVPLSADGSSIWGFNSIEGDIVWRGFGVIVEYNGRLRHVARYGDDLTRANALRASGYQVFLVTSQQMRSARQMLVIGSLVAQGMGMPEPTLPERELLQRLIGEVMSYETPHITL